MRSCLKDPLPEIIYSAEQLSKAVDSHGLGNFDVANRLFKETNLESIRNWTESIWGSHGIHRELINSYGTPKTVLTEFRDVKRMPSKEEERILIQRDGLFCRFCGIPLIRKEVRMKLNKLYPEAIPWGKKNGQQHAAFQAMWLQFDHVIPHARGGKTELNNLVITCAPCNYGRMNFLLDEIDLQMPEVVNKPIVNWDGLERILK